MRFETGSVPLRPFSGSLTVSVSLDMASPKTYIAKPIDRLLPGCLGVTEPIETDVLVLGGGGCGLVSALAAADAGMTVFLIEKSQKLGGHTLMTQGMVPAAGTRFQSKRGLNDTPAQMAEDIIRQNKGQCDRAQVNALCECSAPMVHWLADECGVSFDLVTDFLYAGFSQFRMHGTPNRTGRELVAQLIDAASRKENLFLFTDKSAKELMTDGHGSVTGARVGGDLEEVRAKKVILASGGFGSNREMKTAHIPGIMKMAYFGSSEHTGEGIMMAAKAGAKLAYMDSYQAHSAVSSVGTLISWETMLGGGVMVNKSGRRFANETMGYSSFASHLTEQDDASGYEIFNQEILDMMEAHYVEFRETVSLGGIRRASSLEELAEVTGLDGSALSQSLRDYNSRAAEGEDSFGRTTFRRLDPPYYFAAVKPALFHTQGGVMINKNAQVIGSQGSVIPNLYAGGGTAAGVSGHGGSGYLSGNGLLSALGYGWLAGRHSASSLSH